MIEKTEFGDVVGGGSLAANCGCGGQCGTCISCNADCNWWYGNEFQESNDFHMDHAGDVSAHFYT